jgi:hypothetical protein
MNADSPSSMRSAPTEYAPRRPMPHCEIEPEEPRHRAQSHAPAAAASAQQRLVCSSPSPAGLGAVRSPTPVADRGMGVPGRGPDVAGWSI